MSRYLLQPMLPPTHVLPVLKNLAEIHGLSPSNGSTLSNKKEHGCVGTMELLNQHVQSLMY